jgi:hypothetical protein
MLNPDEAANFRTDFYRYLVKLGVIGDGSCFIHCLLLATRDDYDSAPETERRRMAASFRTKLANSITLRQFEKFSKGNLAQRLFQEQFISLFNSLKSKLNGHKNTFNTIINSVPFSTVYSIIGNTSSISEFVIRLTGEITNANNGRYANETSELLTKLCDKARTKSYETFIERLKDPEEYIDNDLFVAIAHKFNRDVYVFDSNTGQPYQGINNTKRPKDLSIFLVYNEDEAHYELLSIVDHHGDFSVQFTQTHPLVLKTRKALGYKRVKTEGLQSRNPAPLRSPRRSPRKDPRSVIDLPPAPTVQMNNSQNRRMERPTRISSVEPMMERPKRDRRTHRRLSDL